MVVDIIHNIVEFQDHHTWKEIERLQAYFVVRNLVI